MALTVRRARGEDVASITVIERASFSDPWSAASFAALVENARVFFAVAEEDAGVCGYVVAWFVVDEAEIANLAVAPAHRGRGIGVTLLDAALAAAAGHGVTDVYLEVRDSNVRARALYASRGFEAVARRRNYYRRPTEDALVMRRSITTGAP